MVFLDSIYILSTVLHAIEGTEIFPYLLIFTLYAVGGAFALGTLARYAFIRHLKDDHGVSGLNLYFEYGAARHRRYGNFSVPVDIYASGFGWPDDLQVPGEAHPAAIAISRPSDAKPAQIFGGANGCRVAEPTPGLGPRCERLRVWLAG
ncbi:hypothetical protein [Mycobacterium tuberculosis]|uniref:hypothetical protein n=1 Tax=Mycobacterium tuberculosis TaxID=1773 RepID=UPI00272B4872|nr:hypothetical protein [Mycobacterium tuberculosis]